MDDVKIVPKTIEFKDIDAGSTVEQKIRVINVGKTSKTVRFSPLHSKGAGGEEAGVGDDE